MPVSVQLDQAISIARGFYLGDDPTDWSDNDIVSTADEISETSGVASDEIKLFLFAEREARKSGRH